MSNQSLSPVTPSTLYMLCTSHTSQEREHQRRDLREDICHTGILMNKTKSVQDGGQQVAEKEV